MNKHFTDQQLIHAIQNAQNGYDSVFDYLYYNLAWRKQASTFISIRVEDPEQWEDLYAKAITQFIQKVRKRDFEASSKLSTFFVGICKNMSKAFVSNETKRQKKEAAYKAEIIATQSQAEFPDFFENDLNAQLRKRILSKLSPKCKTYIRQRYWSGLTALKMAVLGKVNKQSIDNAIARCKEQIRELIEKDTEIMDQVKLNYGKF